MQVVRWGVPGIVGTLAVIEGSKMFFEKRYHWEEQIFLWIVYRNNVNTSP